MKKVFLTYTAVVALSTTLFTSCSKSGNSTNSTTATVTCNINGVKYSFTSATIKVNTGANNLGLKAYDNLGNTIYQGITNTGNTTVAIGSYPNIGAEDYINGVDYVSTAPIVSSIIITSLHDNLADGTFSGSLTDFATRTKTINVTDGVFKNLPVQQ